MRRALIPFLLLTTLLASGCLTTLGQADAPERQAIRIDPSEMADRIAFWEYISTEFPKHDSYTPANAEIRAYLVGQLEGAGFGVQVRAYPGESQGVQVPGTQMHVIIGVHEGLTYPGRAIGLVSHYDTNVGTVHGAYDDKSGVAAQLETCERLAAENPHRTVACILFDAEEQGLAASRAYVQDAVIEGNSDFVFDFVIGYDMTGINWPGHPWSLYVMQGEPHVPYLKPIAEQVLYDTMAYPMDGVELLDVHDRNSDERRFKEANIPILRLAGGRNAADYPMYHLPGDTVEYVDQFSGGRENFVAGFTKVVEASLNLALRLDQESPETFDAWKADAEF